MKLFGLNISRDRGDLVARRPARPVARSFKAATTPLLVGSTGNTNINIALSSQLHKLRSLSRVEARNNPLGRRYVNLCRTNVIGPKGVGVQCQVRNFDGTMDTLANDAIEAAWRTWCRPGNCSANRTDSWLDIQRLVITSLVTDGEILFEEVDTGPHRYGLRLIDPELLDVRFNQDFGDGRRIIMGVEVDKDWAPLAYYILSDQDSSYHGYRGNRRRVPADRIRHLFIPEAVGQVRGVPWLVPGLLRSQMLDGFAEAAITNARAGAAKMGFYESMDGDGMGDATDTDGNFIDYAEPGHFGILPTGYKFTAYDPAYPSGEYASFAEDHKRDISAAWGVGYNSLTNDLRGVSYSSIRTAVLEDRETWKMLQEFVIERLIQPTYETWLRYALIYAPIIQTGGSSLPVTKYDKFKGASFRGRRWSWIDPLKDVNASTQAIEAKLTSRRRVIQDMGLDPEEVWAELDDEAARFKEDASGDPDGNANDQE